MEPDDSLSRLRERARVRARGLRQRQTQAEQVMWHHLRNRRLLDLKFRRQHAVGPCFADFACIEIGLVIEIDGGQHADAEPHDMCRETAMTAHGYRTLRFWNHEVLNETEAVMERIRQVAITLTPALSRQREREQDKGTTP
ncbi:MAG TPA: DUF559 domain-containing protein [Ramlibacter sp.]|uniref:endonuclease domain-containing protein n=1 Tax=Ramlibacter sp. TaxID=1917967 RepID=UPI002CE18087|nr:DUF559 domain-containing protein [Ramlibacter sp.]HVZ43564.1 DUF559 domain-containing protein [Ramlibacter sp.]